MSTYDDVMAAWRLIENPAHWCKGKARDGDRMCAEGAVFVATEAGYFRGAAALRALAMALPGEGAKCGYTTTRQGQCTPTSGRYLSVRPPQSGRPGDAPEVVARRLLREKNEKHGAFYD